MDKTLMPKTKHDHKWTDKLKVIIFALLILAPLFSVLVKCLYTLNPNAKDSYYGETINQTTREIVQSKSDLKIGETYQLIYDHTDTTIVPNTNNRIYFSEPTEITISTPVTNLETTIQESSYFIFTYYTRNYLVFYDDNNQVKLTLNDGYQFQMTFKLENYSLYGQYTDAFNGYLYEIKYINESYLDNVFFYAVNQIKEEQLFKWVDNTIIYDGLNAMNTGFGLTSNHVLTYLLAYWTILTAIYIVIDIILFLFTKLTHLLQ